MVCFLPFLNCIEFVLVLPAPPAGGSLFSVPVYGENLFSRMTAILSDSLRGLRAPEPRGSLLDAQK